MELQEKIELLPLHRRVEILDIFCQNSENKTLNKQASQICKTYFGHAEFWKEVDSTNVELAHIKLIAILKDHNLNETNAY